MVAPLSFRASATRIDKASRCLRRWALDELYGEGREETEALAHGTELHEQQARYLRDGRPYDMSTLRDTGALALAAIHLVPRPRDPRILVESSFRSDLFGLPWEGTTDVRWLDRPGVLDHKTTTDFRYAKLAPQLVRDIQACLYAHHEMTERRSSWCFLRWIYYRKKKKPYKAFAVDTVVTRETVRPTLERAHKTLLRMYDVAARRLPPMSLEYNPRDCYAFNRECPHVARCNLSKEENWEAFVATEISEAAFLNAIGQQATIAAKSQHLNPPNQDPPMSNDSPPGWYQDAQGNWVQGAPQGTPPPASTFNPPPQGAPPSFGGPPTNGAPWGPPNASPTLSGPPDACTERGVLASGMFPGLVFHPDPSTGAPAEYFHHAAAPPNTWEKIPPTGLTITQISNAPGSPRSVAAQASAGPPPFGAPSGPPPFGGSATPPVGAAVAPAKRTRKDALEKAAEHLTKAAEYIAKAKEATD